MFGAEEPEIIHGTSAERSIFYFAVLFLVILYPAIVIHIFRKNKTWKPIAYICLVVILFCQTLVYVVNIKEEMLYFHKSGSISGMKKAYYGRDALLVRCGSYIYNVVQCWDSLEQNYGCAACVTMSMLCLLYTSRCV